MKDHFECHAWVPHLTSYKDSWEKNCKEMGVPIPLGANMEKIWSTTCNKEGT